MTEPKVILDKGRAHVSHRSRSPQDEDTPLAPRVAPPASDEVLACRKVNTGASFRFLQVTNTLFQFPKQSKEPF